MSKDGTVQPKPALRGTERAQAPAASAAGLGTCRSSQAQRPARRVCLTPAKVRDRRRNLVTESERAPGTGHRRAMPAEYLRTSFRLAAVLETLRLSSSVWWQRGLHPRWLPRPPGLHAIGARCCTRYACRARGPAVDTAKVAECPMRSPGGIAAGLGASPERRVPDADGALRARRAASSGHRPGRQKRGRIAGKSCRGLVWAAGGVAWVVRGPGLPGPERRPVQTLLTLSFLRRGGGR